MTCRDSHVEAAAQLLGPLPLCAASGGLLRPTAAWPLLPGAASSSPWPSRGMDPGTWHPVDRWLLLPSCMYIVHVGILLDSHLLHLLRFCSQPHHAGDVHLLRGKIRECELCKMRQIWLLKLSLLASFTKHRLQVDHFVLEFSIIVESHTFLS